VDFALKHIRGIVENPEILEVSILVLVDFALKHIRGIVENPEILEVSILVLVDFALKRKSIASKS